jgi:hypothetical protein
MTVHAILSASSSSRWLSCTPSARLEQEFKDQETTAAAEGTAAHALAEYKLRHFLEQKAKKPKSEFDGPEMEGYTDDYVSFVTETYETVKQSCKGALMFIEQHLDFSSYVPDGFGTGDCIIVADGKLHVIDFKYGQGLLVNSEHNTQMMLYALGALELFDSLYKIDTVAMTIFQPRRENVSTWEMSVDELHDWAEEVLKPKARLAFGGLGEYKAGPWCQFCKAKIKCRARAEESLRSVKADFDLPPVLTDDELEEILPKLDGMAKWANELMSYAAMAAINTGKHWKGFKLVEGRSTRKFSDEKAVAEAAVKAGFKKIYKKSLITLTEMEKLMTKEKFAEVIGPLVIKPQGKLSLVPIADKRQEVNVNIEEDFKDE